MVKHGARCGGWSTPRPGRFTPGKDRVPIVQEAGWVPGPVWTGAENLAPTGIRSLDLPAHSESLYRLRYPALYIQFITTVCFALQQLSAKYLAIKTCYETSLSTPAVIIVAGRKAKFVSMVVYNPPQCQMFTKSVMCVIYAYLLHQRRIRRRLLSSGDYCCHLMLDFITDANNGRMVRLVLLC